MLILIKFTFRYMLISFTKDRLTQNHNYHKKGIKGYFQCHGINKSDLNST